MSEIRPKETAMDMVGVAIWVGIAIGLAATFWGGYAEDRALILVGTFLLIGAVIASCISLVVLWRQHEERRKKFQAEWQKLTLMEKQGR